MTDSDGQKYLLETPWETRNLGLPAYHLDPAMLDRFDEMILDTELARLSAEHSKFFVFARVGKDFLSVAHALERRGFYLVEGMMQADIRLQSNELLIKFGDDMKRYIPKKYADRNLRFASLTRSQAIASREVLMYVAANTFTDDRFHYDPGCPDDVANQRFSYWIEDLINEPGTVLHVLYLDEEIIGYLATRATQLLVGGFTSKYRKAGLGMYLWFNTCLILRNEGHARAGGLISTNNLMSINYHARLGFKYKDTQYSFHYWHVPSENG